MVLCAVQHELCIIILYVIIKYIRKSYIIGSKWNIIGEMTITPENASPNKALMVFKMIVRMWQNMCVVFFLGFWVLSLLHPPLKNIYIMLSNIPATIWLFVRNTRCSAKTGQHRKSWQGFAKRRKPTAQEIFSEMQRFENFKPHLIQDFWVIR